MARRSSISPTLTVFGIWWIATAYLSLSYDWASMVQTATVVAFGLILGVVAALVSIAVIRSGYRTVVAPTELRGLRCSIGEVPMPMPPPERAEALPALSPLTMPDIPADFVDNWLDEYAAEYPKHAALFKALLLVLNNLPNLPATHVPGGHGGRTLLQHSMLTAWIMTEVSKTWEYDGLRDRNGKKILVPLRNPNYKFRPHDPMVGIIGLAHDIGKIESYTYNDRGEVVGIRSEHDLTGSRMIARMQETWDIPADDRDAMLLAIAHYHHPVELPMAPDQRRMVARDDRTIALMELLIRADFTVTRVENSGEMPTDEEYRSLDSVRSVSPEQLYEEFIALIHEAHRINSGNIKYSVGQISPAPDGKGGLLYLHEESLRTHMMRRLDLQSTEHLGNGRYQITVDLLNVLKARGLLYTIHENLDYSAGNAMWVCEVLGSKNQKVSDWPCVIAVKLNQLEKLQELGFFSSSIKIIRNRFGSHMGRQVKDGPSDTQIFGGLGSSNDIPDAPEPRKKNGMQSKDENRAPKSVSTPATPSTPETPAATKSSVLVAHPEIVSDQLDFVLPLPEDAPVAIDPPGRVEPVLTFPEKTEPSPQADVTLQANKEAQDASGTTRSTKDVGKPHESSVSDQVTADTPAQSTPQPAAASVNVDEIISSLVLAADLGENGKLKCRKGTAGNVVFNLETLLEPGSLASKALSAPGSIDYLASGKIKGVGVTRIKTVTLISLTPPISAAS